MLTINKECRCLPRSKYNDIRRVSFETINRFEWSPYEERDAIGRMHIGESKAIFEIDLPVYMLPPSFDWDEPACRVCHKGQLRVGRIAGGQEWGVCRHCNFTGDPVDYSRRSRKHRWKGPFHCWRTNSGGETIRKLRLINGAENGRNIVRKRFGRIITERPPCRRSCFRPAHTGLTLMIAKDSAVSFASRITNVLNR